MVKARAALRLRDAIEGGDGTVIARFFDINHLLANRDSCALLAQEPIGSNLWASCLTTLLQVPLQGTTAESFQAYIEAATIVIRQFDTLDQDLSVPCIRPIARSLRHFASAADYTESVTQLQKLLPHERSDNSLLSVANALFATYFLRNNFKQASNLLKTVDVDLNRGRLSFRSFTPSEIITFRFNEGRTYAVKGEIAKAYESLLYAWEHCPFEQRANRKLVLIYLFPVQLCRGYFPDHRLLTKYGLDMYDEFVTATTQGNIEMYDRAIDSRQILLIKLGLYEIMAKARRVVFWQLIRFVHTAWGDTQVPVIAVHKALNLFQHFTIEETIAILSTLIDAKMVRAYIDMAHGVIVFRRQDAFTPAEAETF
jgi:hypothetical protein